MDGDLPKGGDRVQQQDPADIEHRVDQRDGERFRADSSQP